MSQNITPIRQFHPMETPQKQKERTMDIGSLLSPPETKQSDTFSSPVSMSIAMSRTSSASTQQPASQSQGSNYAVVMKKDTRPLPSPPISPQSNFKDDVVRAYEGTRDPPLYSSQDTENSNNGPLFPQPEQAAIDSHIATSGSICSADEYRLVLDTLSNMKFNTSVGAGFNQNREKWWATSLQTFAFYDDIKAKSRAASQAAKGKKASGKASTQRRLAPAPEGGIRRKVTVPRVQRVPKPRRSPPQHVFGDFSFPVKEVLPKAPKIITSRDDVDFHSIPDFCPPVENLGHNAKALKADWKGAMLDLSTDPDRHLLHEAEVNLAATLRLSCATYLTSKRRIFVARVQCGQRGKEFRKTDAQQACKIDVNKASKLWTAFEKVGWFDDRFFVGKHA